MKRVSFQGERGAYSEAASASFFKNEIKLMCSNYSFLKNIISMTIFNKKINDISELQYNLSTFLRKKFNIQVFKKKGIVVHSKEIN